MGDELSTPRGVRLLIVGHSHTWCYGGQFSRSPDDYEMKAIDEGRGFMRIGGRLVDLGYWDAVVELAKTVRVAVCWQGNEHAQFMFLERPFDFALASHPGLVVDQGVDLVPELQVREMFQPSMSSRGGFESSASLEILLTRLLDAGGPRPIVLGTPPPKGDNEAIRRGMQVHADFFTNFASDRGLDYEKAPLAPAYLRLKLWFLLQQMMRETAERLTVEFWPVSETAMTEEGYLRPEYWAEDATHANEAYGALMLDEYEKRLLALETQNEEFEVRAPANGRYRSMRSPVFIVGSPRSGTSALVGVLNYLGYHGFLEGNFLNLLHHIEFSVDRYFEWAPESDPNVMVANIDKHDLKRRLFETFRTMVNDLNPKEPWFDKSGGREMIWAIPIVRELWPGSVFVYAKRRGIENIISRVKKFPSESFEYHCDDWARHMAVWRRIRQELPPGCFVEIDQRDMIQQPDLTARRLCALLQMDESAAVNASYVMTTQRPQESAEGSASKTLSLAASGWTIEQTQTFLELCETEMTAFGYTMDEHYSATP